MEKAMVTEKNTKNEILKAYHDLLAKKKEEQSTKLDPVKEMKEKKANETLEKASEKASLSIEDQIANLQKNTASLLANLSTSIAEEIKAFNNVQEAIELKKAELKELFEIEKEAYTLAALINSHEEISDQFQEDMLEKRETAQNELNEILAQIKEAKAQHEAEMKQKKAELEMNRKRELEEYEYEFKRRKQRDNNELTDELAQKKKEYEAYITEENAKLEVSRKEVSDREANVEVREEKMTELEAKVAAFPEREAQIRKEVEDQVRKDEARTLAIKENYFKKDSESKIAILEGKIALLEQNLENERAKNAEQAAKLDAAYDKIQGMALASVNGSSDSKTLDKLEKMLAGQKDSQK